MSIWINRSNFYYWPYQYYEKLNYYVNYSYSFLNSQICILAFCFQTRCQYNLASQFAMLVLFIHSFILTNLRNMDFHTYCIVLLAMVRPQKLEILCHLIKILYQFLNFLIIKRDSAKLHLKCCYFCMLMSDDFYY